MVIEGNEYGQSVTLAAVPGSALKCVLSLCQCCLLAAVVFLREWSLFFFTD